MLKLKLNNILTILMIIVFFGGIFIISDTAIGGTMGERLKGYILLQVEQNGESWYIYPPTQNRFYLGRPTDAFSIMRNQGLGITNADLNKIPRAGMDDNGDINLQQRLSGYILLQVELNGEAWYVNPRNLQRYFLSRPTDAFNIMRNLGLGITDNDLNQITTDENSLSTPPISSDTNPSPDETVPVLTKFFVDFGAYNAGTNKAGDFDFSTNNDKVFGEFGRIVIGPEGPKTLPSYDVFLTADTAIESPFAGEVVAVLYQESTQDYEIHMRLNKLNVWAITFDHIKNLSAYITVGAQVTAGQYLGKPSPWGNSYMVELMIFRDVNGSTQAYCPYDFFSTSLKSELTTSISTLMSDWETFKGDNNIYDESSYIKPGCVVNTTAS